MLQLWLVAFFIFSSGRACAKNSKRWGGEREGGRKAREGVRDCSKPTFSVYGGYSVLFAICLFTRTDGIPYVETFTTLCWFNGRVSISGCIFRTISFIIFFLKQYMCLLYIGTTRLVPELLIVLIALLITKLQFSKRRHVSLEFDPLCSPPPRGSLAIFCSQSEMSDAEQEIEDAGRDQQAGVSAQAPSNPFPGQQRPKMDIEPQQSGPYSTSTPPNINQGLPSSSSATRDADPFQQQCAGDNGIDRNTLDSSYGSNPWNSGNSPSVPADGAGEGASEHANPPQSSSTSAPPTLQQQPWGGANAPPSTGQQQGQQQPAAGKGENSPSSSGADQAPPPIWGVSPGQQGQQQQPSPEAVIRAKAPVDPWGQKEAPGPRGDAMGLTSASPPEASNPPRAAITEGQQGAPSTTAVGVEASGEEGGWGVSPQGAGQGRGDGSTFSDPWLEGRRQVRPDKDEQDAKVDGGSEAAGGYSPWVQQRQHHQQQRNGPPPGQPQHQQSYEGAPQDDPYGNGGGGGGSGGTATPPQQDATGYNQPREEQPESPWGGRMYGSDPSGQRQEGSSLPPPQSGSPQERGRSPPQQQQQQWGSSPTPGSTNTDPSGWRTPPPDGMPGMGGESQGYNDGAAARSRGYERPRGADEGYGGGGATGGWEDGRAPREQRPGQQQGGMGGQQGQGGGYYGQSDDYYRGQGGGRASVPPQGDVRAHVPLTVYGSCQGFRGRRIVPLFCFPDNGMWSVKNMRELTMRNLTFLYDVFLCDTGVWSVVRGFG